MARKNKVYAENSPGWVRAECGHTLTAIKKALKKEPNKTEGRRQLREAGLLGG